MPSYNERLTVNNQKIDDITTLANELPDADEINEKIDEQDTIIENLKSALDEKAGKGGAKLNVFTQLTEPTTKKGIWLQTDKQMEHFISDDNIFIGGTWALASDTTSIPYYFYRGSAISIGTNIFLLGSSESPYNQNYKYDVLSKTYTKMTDIPYEYHEGSAVAVGTDIYILGCSQSDSYTKNYKYDTLTDTYTQMRNIPYSFYNGSAVAVGTDIYIFGSRNNNYYRYSYKYDTITNTYTKLNNIPFDFYYGSSVAIGTSIYLMKGMNLYKYDTITNTYTQLANVPYNCSSGSCAAVGTNIYLFGGDGGTSSNRYNCYKYNTLTNTYTQLTNIPYSFREGFAVAIGTNAYLLGGVDSKTTNRKFYAENKTYITDNSVIVAQGRTYDIGYNVELLITELAEEDFQPLYRICRRLVLHY